MNNFFPKKQWKNLLLELESYYVIGCYYGGGSYMGKHSSGARTDQFTNLLKDVIFDNIHWKTFKYYQTFKYFILETVSE